MTQASTHFYPDPIAEILREIPLAPLGPGEPLHAFQGRLAAINDDTLGSKILDHHLAACCRSGLWLAFGFLDTSHEISQNLDTAEGSYWHALMHRREPDHGNAAYWLRRVGRHPIHTELARLCAVLGYLTPSATWDPFTFNDHCEARRTEDSAATELLRRVQQAEWSLLFEFCFRHATGQVD